MNTNDNTQTPNMSSLWLGFPVQVAKSGEGANLTALISKQTSLAVNDLNERVAALEANKNARHSGPDRTQDGPDYAGDNQPLIDAITQAHDAIARAIALLKQTAKENRNGL